MLSVFLVVMMLLTACQQNSDGLAWQVEGTAAGLADGDMLLLVDIDGEAIDSTTISHGKFSFTGTTDSVCFYSVYVAKDEMNSVSFLTEPGTIEITLTEKAGDAKVGGTVANDALQELVETVNPYYERIEELEQALFQDTTRNTEKKWALMERYAQIAEEIGLKVREAAEKNADNELGFLLLTKFIDLSEYADFVKALIARLPEDYCRRQQVMALKKLLNDSEEPMEADIQTEGEKTEEEALQ